MDNPQPPLMKATLHELRRLLTQPSTVTAPTGHDLLNALHTVLCSIEMLEMDITKPQREVFDRLESGAKQLEELLQAYIVSSGKSRASILAKLDFALEAE